MKTILNLAAITILFSTIAFANINAQPITVTGTKNQAHDGDYASLTLAGGVFATLNGAPDQAGENIFVNIKADVMIEDGTFSLNEGTWTSLTIFPSNGNRIISGTSIGGDPLIEFYKADRVLINGINLLLTIQNLNISNLAENSTIMFKDGSTNNTVRACKILGSSQNQVNVPGGTICFYDDDDLDAGGNDDNIIRNNDIGPAPVPGKFPFKAVFGWANGINNRNHRITIDSNRIYDFFGTGATNTYGVYSRVLGGTAGLNDWIVTRNKIYQTGLRTFTNANLQYAGIVLTIGSHEVSENTIGFASRIGMGKTSISGPSFSFFGIYINEAGYGNVDSNKISGINQTISNGLGSFTGINSDCRVDINMNEIGSLNGLSKIEINTSAEQSQNTEVIGIRSVTTTNRHSKIDTNYIGNFIINQSAGIGTDCNFRGISVLNDFFISGRADITRNVIEKITNNLTGRYSIFGIQSKLSEVTIFRNTVRDMVGKSSLAGVLIADMAGIVTEGSSGDYKTLIEKNRVYNLSHLNDAGFEIVGLDLEFPETDNIVKQNYVYKLDATSTSFLYKVIGIRRRGKGKATIHNNMVTLGYKADGTNLALPEKIIGIYDDQSFVNDGSNNKYYYNTINIRGQAEGVGDKSYCMYSNSFNNIREFKNNIFYNNRSEGKNYAVRFDEQPDPPATRWISNFNDLHASGIGGVLGSYNEIDIATLPEWRTATGEDLNSSSIVVVFTDKPNGDLHIAGKSIGDEFLSGTPIPGIEFDIDDEARPAIPPLKPYMGADENVNFPLPIELTSFTSSINERNVSLNWSTTSETNNAGFEIQRSSSEIWTRIGNLTGNGTTSSSCNYSFTDRNLETGIYNYRLKQIDFNGNFQYYYLENEVVIGTPDKFYLSQNYPNPFNPTTKIDYDLPHDGLVRIILYDISGREVYTLVNGTKPAGYYTLEFNANNLSSGIYFYRIIAGEFISAKRMALLK